MASIGTIKVRVGADIKGLKRGLKDAEYRLKSFGRNVGGAADSINRNITIPFALAGAASIKMATEFESSMTKISSQVGIAGDEVEKMKSQVLDLAGETARAPRELADAMFFVQSAGLRGAEAMDVLEMSAKAASAGFGETKIVADLVTSAMNAYGSEVLNAGMATDVLAATVREGKADAESLTNAMGSALPMATAMGIEFNELGAAIAGMTRTGTNADTAVTQLGQIMMTFQKPAAEAEKTMSMLGLSAAELRKRIADEGLMNVLVDLRKRLKEAGLETAELFRDKRALAGVLDLTGGNMKDNIAIMERMNDVTGDSAKAFEIASETAEFKFNQALANLQKSSIELGNTLLPLAVDFVDSLSDLVKWFDGLDESTKKNIVNFALMASSLGIGLKAVSLFSGGIAGLTKAFNFMIPATAKAGRALTTLDKVMNATKIGLIIAGVTAAYYAYKRLTDSINSAAKEQARIESITKGANIAIQKETTSVQALFDTLKSGESTQEERTTAYDELNARYPSILGNITAETKNLKKLEAAQDAVTESIIQRIAAEKKNEAVGEYLGQVAELQVRYQELANGAKSTTDEQLRFFELMKGEASLSTMALDRTGVVMAGMQKEIENLKASAKDVGMIFDEAFGEREVNIPKGGDRGARYKERIAKEKAAREKELAAKRAAEAERQELRDKQAKSVKKLYATLAKELNKANELYKIHGNFVDMNADKQKALQSAIEGLIDLGFKAGSDAVQDLVRDMSALQNETDNYKAGRIIQEVEKINNLTVGIPIEFTIPTIDELPDTTYEVDVRFAQEPITGFAATIQDLFNKINENGGKIGENFGKDFIKGVDAATQAYSAFAELQASVMEKQRAELEEEFARERERIEQTVSSEAGKEEALAKLEERYTKKKQALQKKAAKQQKVASISESIINTAVAVTNAYRTDPTGILAAIVGAIGAAQTAVIASTPIGYAKGGKVKVQEGKVSGVTNATPRADGDHILAYLKAGEAVLNANQIKAIGPDVLAAARVPGFSVGGSVGRVNSSMMGVSTTPDGAMRINVQFDEPRWDGEEMVLGIKRVEQNLSSHNAI